MVDVLQGYYGGMGEMLARPRLEISDAQGRVAACFVRVQMPKEGLVDLGIESLTKTPVPDILTGEK
jgi:hypothetical protein